MTKAEYEQLGGIVVTIGSECNCYKIQLVGGATGIGIGEYMYGYIWPYNSGPSNTLQFGASGYNPADRYRMQVWAGLNTNDGTNPTYTLLQNVNNTPVTWTVGPTLVHGIVNSTQQCLNILSGVGGEYFYKVNHKNRCFPTTGSDEYFWVNFSGRRLTWRINPNPVKDELMLTKYVNMNTKEEKKPLVVNFSIINLYTKQVLYGIQQNNNTDNFKIHVQNFEEGEYILQIKYGEEIFNEKLFIRK